MFKFKYYLTFFLLATYHNNNFHNYLSRVGFVILPEINEYSETKLCLIHVFIYLSNAEHSFTHFELVWGLIMWRSEQAPVWELSWYWLESSAHKIAIICQCQYQIPRWILLEQQSYQWCGRGWPEILAPILAPTERYLNLDLLFIYNHKSWMSQTDWDINDSWSQKQRRPFHKNTSDEWHELLNTQRSSKFIIFCFFTFAIWRIFLRKLDSNMCQKMSKRINSGR